MDRRTGSQDAKGHVLCVPFTNCVMLAMKVSIYILHTLSPLKLSFVFKLRKDAFYFIVSDNLKIISYTFNKSNNLYNKCST